MEMNKKANLDHMSEDQAEVISELIGEKVRKICDEAVEKANKLLNVYGMSAKMQIVIDHPDLKQEANESLKQ